MKTQINISSFILFLVLSLQGVNAGAVAQSSMDDQLIEKMNYVYLNLANNDASKLSVTLRLADLLSERARKESRKELEAGCSPCVAGVKDRQKALSLYKEALPKTDPTTRLRVMVQVGHLHDLLGQDEQAVQAYQTVIKESVDENTKAESLMAMGEMKFKKRQYAPAKDYFTQVLKYSSYSQRGYAQYRLAWSEFNLQSNEKAVQLLKEQLSNPKLLTRGSNTQEIDTEFQEEVAHDLVTFSARRKLKTGELEEINGLLPRKNQLGNLRYLALEQERLGFVEDANKSWLFLIDKQSEPQDRLESMIHLADLYRSLQDRPKAYTYFQKAIDLWPDAQKNCANCKELKLHLRKTVIGWNEVEKKKPSDELVQAYQKYTSLFPDTDMILWQAQASALAGKSDVSYSSYKAAAQAVSEELKNKTVEKKADKEKWLEASLIGMIDSAEKLKSVEFQKEAYTSYISLSVQKSKSYEVHYQLAHLLYEKGSYEEASKELRLLALDSKGSMEWREKSADLALDSLVLLKKDAELAEWSKEFSVALPKKKKEFEEVRRKTILNQSVEQAKAGNDAQALATLSAWNGEEASNDEKKIVFKNKILLAEKTKNFREARSSVDEYLKLPNLNQEEQKFALSQKAYLSELVLDFPSSLDATQKMPVAAAANAEAKADHSLKLALLASLSNKDAKPFYQQYLKTTPDTDKAALVAKRLLSSSSQPKEDWKIYQAYIAKKPELYADALLDLYTRTKDVQWMELALKKPEIKNTTSGRLLVQEKILAQYQDMKKLFEASKIESKNQVVLTKSLKSRINLIDKAENLAKQAIDDKVWAGQIVTLHLLAEEHKRFYQEVMALPMPQGLTEEEQSEYLGMLSTQAGPHLTKSKDIEAKLGEFWSQKQSFKEFQDSIAAVDGYKSDFLARQWKMVEAIAPKDMQSYFVAQTKVRDLASVSLADLEQARQSVRENPLTKEPLQKLLQLEKKAGREDMVGYLEKRIEDLGKETH